MSVSPATRVAAIQQNLKMAKGKTSTESALLPNATRVIIDGNTLIVPFDKNENANANKILAAQMRQAIQLAIKSYKDGEQTLTPKELNDLAMAVKNITSMSKDVYESAEPMQTPKPSADVEVQADEVDFGAPEKTE